MYSRIILLFAILLMVVAPLIAEKAGVVSYLLGDIKYKANPNAAWVKLGIDDSIDMQGILKSELDSEMEIQWTDNSTCQLPANTQVSVKALYEQAHKNRTWSTRLQDKVTQLSLQNKQKAVTTAGVRKDEAEVKTETELFWYMTPLVTMDEAIAVYQQQKYADAVILFQKIIDQGPLSNNAEIARGYLIICYDKLNDKKNVELQIQKLKTDFPHSSILENVSEDKQ